MKPEILKEIDKRGIRDVDLLRDLLSRGLYLAAAEQTYDDIQRKTAEVNALQDLQTLIEEKTIHDYVCDHETTSEGVEETQRN